MSPLAAAFFLTGALAVPAWLLAMGRRYRYRSRRVRGAFWGGVAGHVLGDALLLGALLTPPFVWPPGRPMWVLGLLLLAPPLLGMGIGALVGRRRPAPRG